MKKEITWTLQIEGEKPEEVTQQTKQYIARSILKGCTMGGYRIYTGEQK